MLYYSIENENKPISVALMRKALVEAIESAGSGKQIFIIPPDITRVHSGAGALTRILWEEYRDNIVSILPATGTHVPMTVQEIKRMYGEIPLNLFSTHNCRKDIVTLGTIPSSHIRKSSGGKLNYDWPVQVNRIIADNAKSLIISVGQVVPHEVTGMANYNKNVFIGCGGYESISKSHYLGAVYGIERIMGKAINPVREIINLGERLFAGHLQILYVLTVVGPDPEGRPVVKGLYIGSDIECFNRASEFSAKINIKEISEAPEKIVVYLKPEEYRSTWLGNKAIYRTRRAIGIDGELVILAPGIDKFGEDPEIDRLIRKYGYRHADEVIDLVEKNNDLQENLGVAAHLIHGSPEGRFRVTYCTGGLGENEIRKSGFGYGNIEDKFEKYDITKLKEGYNTLADGEKIYYISNPGLGLWKTTSKHFSSADGRGF